MALKDKVNQILNDFPALVGHEDVVEFVLDIREAFKLKKVPFRIQAGDFDSGHLRTYYKHIEAVRVEKRLKANKKREKNAKRKGSAGWKRMGI